MRAFGACGKARRYSAFENLLRSPASPIRPEPRRNRMEGSGVGIPEVEVRLRPAHAVVGLAWMPVMKVPLLAGLHQDTGDSSLWDHALFIYLS